MCYIKSNVKVTVHSLIIFQDAVYDLESISVKVGLMMKISKALLGLLMLHLAVFLTGKAYL